MSDNNYKFADLEILKHEAKQIMSAYSGVFKLVKERYKEMFNASNNAAQKISAIERLVLNSYVPAYLSNAFEQLRNLRNLQKPTAKTGIEEAKEISKTRFYTESSKLGGDFYRRVEFITKNLIKDCGYDHAKRIARIPVTYHIYRDRIGSLGTNKALVWARSEHDPDYSCWKIMYLTYKYQNRQKIIFEVECWAMKDMASNTLYFHEDKNMCKRGLRRHITMKISKRMAGAL